ncbi:MAG: hypothetical protein LUG16_03355 [Candidatus Gastranaerophilales bacterium]|nr:hypothetical protein [Candidatus Gastranaerophilales bacterium]
MKDSVGVRSSSNSYIFLKFLIVIVSTIVILLFVLPAEDLNKITTYWQDKIGILPKNSEDNTKVAQENKISDSVVLTKKHSQIEYEKLLDELAAYEFKDLTSVRYAVNKILEFKGYPPDIVPVLEDKGGNTRDFVEGIYVAAYFMPSTGGVYVNPKTLQVNKKEVIISILFHELDHFDVFAKICKSMGVEAYLNYLQMDNYSFWEQVAPYANIDGFDYKYYLNAVDRKLTLKNIDVSSLYSYLYIIAEDRRNPLEIRAYDITNNILEYYKQETNESMYLELVKAFNETDWVIYDTIYQNPLLKNQRIAIFDYIFAKVIMQKYPQFKDVYVFCISNNKGNLSHFWNNFNKAVIGLGSDLVMNQRSLNILVELLKEIEAQARSGLTDIEIANALNYKASTIYANVFTTNSTNNLRRTCSDYLKFIKSKNINAPSEELKQIIMLICVENNITTASKVNVDLDKLRIPVELIQIYDTHDKRNRLNFIYQNAEFKRLTGSVGSRGTDTESKIILRELIKAYRIPIQAQL